MFESVPKGDVIFMKVGIYIYWGGIIREHPQNKKINGQFSAINDVGPTIKKSLMIC